jgi:hypothetical protein
MPILFPAKGGSSPHQSFEGGIMEELRDYRGFFKKDLKYEDFSIEEKR